MIEHINKLIGVNAREEQIRQTWKVPLMRDWRATFYASDLAEQEKWGVMTTYLSLVTLVPAAASAFFNPVIGGTLIAADVAVGIAGWIRSRRAITAVGQEQAARHL